MILSFMAHYVCSQHGVGEQSVVRIDTDTRDISVTTYEKEIAGTIFCDGVLLLVNDSFDAVKEQIDKMLAENEFTDLRAVADALCHCGKHTLVTQPPLSRLYALQYDYTAKTLHWQPVARI